MAITADGIIARHRMQNADWTSKADKKNFVAETKKHGVIIMGRTTYEAIGRPLPGRLNIVLTLDPKKYKAKQVDGLLEFVSATPAQLIEQLKDRGYQSAMLGGGAKTNAIFLKAGLVDEIMLTIEPKIFGNGINFTESEDLDIELELLETKKLDDNVLQLHYKVKK